MKHRIYNSSFCVWVMGYKPVYDVGASWDLAHEMKLLRCKIICKALTTKWQELCKNDFV